MKRVVLGCLVLAVTMVFAASVFAGEFKPVTDNKVPKNAFIAGFDVGGEPLTICRAEVTQDGKKGVVFGKAGNHLGGKGNCRAEFNDEVVYFEKFDVLTVGSYVPAGPIWSNRNAPKQCGEVTEKFGGWVEDSWMTTVPGKMSICETVYDLGYAVIFSKDSIE